MSATLQVVWADSGYAGFLEGWAKAMFGWMLTIVKRTDAMRGKFVMLPRHWVVERTFAWLGNYRRFFQGLRTAARDHRGVCQNFGSASPCAEAGVGF